jgi:sporulation integral membrane protein YtvI
MEISAKTKYYIKVAIITAVVYFTLKFLLPIFLPFIFAYILAYILRPTVTFLNEKMGINKKISIVILVVIMVCLLGAGIGFIVNATVAQVKNFCKNYAEYEEKLDDITDQTCDSLEKYSGIDSENIREYVDKSIDTVTAVGTSQNTVQAVMNKSVDTVVTIGELIVFILTMIISLYYMLSAEQLGKKILINRVCQVCAAYIKTQLIIMSITTSICFVSFIVIKNKYALLLALVIGFLDALPLIGVGMILVPWGVMCIMMGYYGKAVIILITFAVCYLIRELIEPKLMSSQMGIKPLETIISMYAGYKIFGIIGVVLGPVGYILISTLILSEEISN